MGEKSEKTLGWSSGGFCSWYCRNGSGRSVWLWIRTWGTTMNENIQFNDCQTKWRLGFGRGKNEWEVIGVTKDEKKKTNKQVQVKMIMKMFAGALR